MLLHGFFVELLFFDERVADRDLFPVPQVDVVDLALTFGQQAFQPAGGQSEHAHVSDVALHQGVGGLGRAVGHEDDVLGGNAVFSHAVREGLYDACRDAVGMIVSGLDLGNAHDLMGVVVDGHRLGVGAAHIDAHADASFAHLWFLLISEGARQKYPVGTSAAGPLQPSPLRWCGLTAGQPRMAQETIMMTAVMTHPTGIDSRRKSLVSHLV